MRGGTLIPSFCRLKFRGVAGAAALCRVAAAAEEAVFGPLASLVEGRRLCPDLVDRRQRAGYRGSAVDGRDPRLSLGYSASAGLPRKAPTPRAQGKVAISAIE